MMSDASLTSASVRSGPPVTLMMTPRAPCIDASSSSGLEMAAVAASLARFSPFATPVPMIAMPMRDMIVRDVREIEIDQAGHQNEIRNALNRLPQHVVGRRERLGHARGLGHGRQQALVRNHDHRVDGVGEVLEAGLGLQRALAALELERLGDDRDGQRAELVGQTGDDGRGAGAGAAAQARS